MNRLLLAAAPVLLAAACGPNYLTPDLVREHLESPKGVVSQETMPRVAKGFFRAKNANAAEESADFLRSTAGGRDPATMTSAVEQGAAETASDVFCAASIAANVAELQRCDDGHDCDVDITVDACALRVGEDADPNARGSVQFKLKNTSDDTTERTELRITFNDFTVTDADDEDVLRRLAGIIALETTEIDETDHSSDEVIFSADVDFQKKKRVYALLEDPVLARARFTAAVRFTGDETATDQMGRLELLAFVDDDDDARDESVTLLLQAESHDLGDRELASASLEVHGSNGSFVCTWSGASEDLGADGERYESQGECVDENGETFSFTSEVTES